MTAHATPQRRPKGTGSLYEVGDRWMIAYRGSDGKRHRELFATKSAAQKILRKRCGARDSGLPVMPGAEKTTWDQGVTFMREDFETAGKRSWATVETKIRLHLAPVFGGRRLIAITSAHAVSYAAARQKAGASNGQINRELQILKRILSLAVRHGKLPSRPHVALLRENNVRQGFFDDAQVASVCAKCEPEIADVIRFAYITGWRTTSEILPLQWHQVDFAADEIRLAAGSTKNGEGRVFPLTDDLRTLLKRRHQDHERLKKAGLICPLVFWRMVADERGGTKKPQAIKRFEKQWRNACRAAGLPGRIVHDLRRSSVRNFVRRGLSEHVAMKLSGHKTASVFRRYDVVSPGDLRAAADLLNAPAPGKAGTGA